MSLKYVLDSDVFIQAFKGYYCFDLCPAFWEALTTHHDRGTLITLDHVKNEINECKDELSDWFNQLPLTWFAPTDGEEIIKTYVSIMKHVSQGNYKDSAKSHFASGADGWVIAFAAATNCIVVTQEVSARDSKKKIKIPDICDAIGVEHIGTYEMLRALGVKFS